MTLVLKSYRENPEFPDGGKFTQHLEKNVNVGDILMCEGPFGLLKYEGNGNFLFKKAPLKQNLLEQKIESDSGQKFDLIVESESLVGSMIAVFSV